MTKTKWRYGWVFLNGAGGTHPTSQWHAGDTYAHYAVLPRPDEKWSDWTTHPDPDRTHRIGPGRLMIKRRPTPPRGCEGYWPWYARWQKDDEIGRGKNDVSVVRYQLRRVRPEVFARMIRLGWLKQGDENFLRRSHLDGCDLSQMDLRYLDLHGADLAHFGLAGANLYRADLHGSRLHLADLSYANLERSVLIMADLETADLSGAILNRADMTDAILEFADLEMASLGDAILTNTHLHGATLIAAYLGGAHCKGTDLEHAYLQRANLKCLNLSHANLTKATLDGADTYRTIFPVCKDKISDQK